MKNPTITRVIVNKTKKKKYWDLPILITKEGSQTLEWIRSKISTDIDSLLLKCKS